MVRLASISADGARSRLASFRSLLPLLAVAGGGACHGSTALTPSTSGTLVTSLQQPAGASAVAVVGGPSSFAVFVFAGDTTLTLLSTGVYTMTDAVATAIDPIVTPFYEGTITGSPVTLGDGDTAHMSATFALIAGSGHAWIGSASGGSSSSAGYNSTQLTTPSAPGRTLSIAGAYQVLDSASNLWVADSATNTIAEYAAASLGSSGTPAAVVTITSSALSGPIGLAFDRDQDLWIANATGNSIVEFTASQLASGGTLTPAVTLNGASISNPGRIAFDPFGNLWVPNMPLNTVVQFSTSQLGVSGAPAPAVTLSSTSSSLAGPRAIAFDEGGNLWVANATGNTFVKFGIAQQDASGSPTPIGVVTVPSAVGGPSGFAFDNSGDLWAFGTASSTVIEYSAPQLTTTGASQPSFSLQVASNPVSLVFDPRPDGLPLAGPTAAPGSSRHGNGPVTSVGKVIKGRR